MKQTILLITLFVTIPFTTAFSQDWSLRANAGVTANAHFADGYYFSFDVGIPINHFIQVAPTFSFASVGTTGFTWNSISVYDDGTKSLGTGTPVGGPERTRENKDLMGSINLLVLINPFNMISGNREKIKHEFLIGGGYGYKTYVQTNTLYSIDGQDYELISTGTKTNSGFEPYFFKMMYNYNITEDLLSGIVVGIDGYDGEGTFNAGLQFGVRF